MPDPHPIANTKQGPLRQLVAVALLAALAACAPKTAAPPTAETPAAVPAPAPTPPPKLVLSTARFADLPGWDGDNLADFLAPLLVSCERMVRAGAKAIDGFAFAGTGNDWADACQAAKAVARNDGAAVRRLIEREFRPLAVTDNGRSDGLLTGYYEPSLKGSRRKSPRYSVPILGMPKDLVSVDLGQFREALKGQRLAGRVVGRELKPYEDRERIEAGALNGQNLELVWAEDPVDVFFLHIQGSGRVELDDGKIMRIGYAAQNGHPYVAIGRVLIDRGLMTRDEVSMQTLRSWLKSNPAEGAALMRQNPSYVFFRELGPEAATAPGPLGAMGAALTPKRSLAVDRAIWPLGLPIWIDATEPAAMGGLPDRPLRRLMLAQDTGGAIRGVVRGDVFYGHGPEAAEVSGRMKNPARFWVLLPRAVAQKAAAANAGAANVVPGG